MVTGLPRRPFGQPPISAILGLFVRQPSLAAGNRNSVRTSPIPSQLAGSSLSISAGSAMLTTNRDRASRRRSRPAASGMRRHASVARSAALARAAKSSRVAGAGSMHSVAVSPSISASRGPATPPRSRGSADNHRNPSRSRERCDMARGAAARQSDAAAATPVGREEARRRHILADDDRARRAGRDRVAAPEQDGEHPVADVPQIAGARLEMLVFGRLVAADFVVERRSPTRSALAPAAIIAKAGSARAFILQHGDLEGEDFRAIALGVERPVGELGERRGDRVAQAPAPRRPGLPPLRLSELAFSRTARGPAAKPAEATLPGETKLSHSRSRIDLLRPSLRLHGSRGRPDSRKRCDRRRGVGTPGSEIQGGALRRLDRHDLDDALGVDPGAVFRKARPQFATRRFWRAW